MEDIDLSEVFLYEYLNEMYEAYRCDTLEEMKKAKDHDYAFLKRKTSTYHRLLDRVAVVAWKYMGRGIRYWDLLKVGEAGLRLAMEKYVGPRLSLTFINIVDWYIMRSILTQLLVAHKVIACGERQATDEELARELKWTLSKVRETREAAGEAEALVVPKGMTQDTADKALSDLLPLLTALQQKVLTLRLGLAGNIPQTQEEVAQQLNMPLWRERLSERNAIRKLRQKAH